MGIKVLNGSLERIKAKLMAMLPNMEEELKLVGEVAAEAIVRTTLAGIGEDDSRFVPYSRVYQELLDSVGGKPRQNVDLRGLFYHEGQKRKRYRSEKSRQREGEGRRAYIGVSFGGTSFTAITRITRPQMGITDPRSEMSLDLIHVEVSGLSLTIAYTPRKEAYMLIHQGGEGKMPQRKWFSIKKAAVWEAMVATLATCLQARAVWFNTHGSTGTPPPPDAAAAKRAGRDASNQHLAGGTP